MDGKTDPHGLRADHPLLVPALASNGLTPADMDAIIAAGCPRDILTPGGTEIVYRPRLAVIHLPDARGRRHLQVLLGAETWAEVRVSRVGVVWRTFPEAIVAAAPGRLLSDLVDIPGAARVRIERIVNDRGRSRVDLLPFTGDNP